MNNETCHERPHAKIGPSSLKYFNMCAGYQPHGGSSAASERGDRIHFALETGDWTQLQDEEEIDITQECFDQREALITAFKISTGDTDPIRLMEERLYMDLGCTETFGTSDLLVISGKHGLKIDYKSGVSAIDPPPENWQSTAYCIGAFQAHPELEEITMAFICPRFSPEPLIGTYYRDQLKEYIRRVAKVVLRAEIVGDKWTDDGGRPDIHELNPGDACTWCLNPDRCPALGAVAIEVATRYAPELMPEGGVRYDEVWDPVEKAKLYTAAKILEKWSKSFRYKMVSDAKDGEEFPGLRLKSMGSPREVTDIKSLVTTCEEHGITTEQLLHAGKYSLAELGKIIKDRTARGKKSEAVRDFEDVLEFSGAVTKQAERFTLVGREDDDE